MFQFKTKAQVLLTLKNQLTNGIILPLVSFTVNDWENNSKTILSQIKTIRGNRYIIRSSALNEDLEECSCAGQYLSVLDVEEKNICQAINNVILSYGNNDGKNEVFVQPMLQDVELSGVAFSLDPHTGSEYISINYEESGNTTCVTSGKKSESYVCFYYYKHSPIPPPKKLSKVINLVKELEKTCNIPNLDIEFAIDKSGNVYLFQVRPLIIQTKCSISADLQTQTLDRIYQKIQSQQNYKPYLHGRRTIFSNMTDWNPAEILGTRSDPLGLSLYKELICDEIWAYQRDNYGYNNLRSFPLLISFGGLPYVDVRVSLNSFIPKKLDKEISERLTEYYLNKLIDNPQLHDKVEFDVVFSCYSFDIDEKLQILLEHGFDQNDISAIKDELLLITNSIINDHNQLISNDIAKINSLNDKRKFIMDSQMDKVSKIYWLLEDCKRFGTLPFAGLARSGFIAIMLLKSLVHINVFSKEDYQNFIANINSVYSNLLSEVYTLDKADFLEKYGHLRPGTYCITSERYDEAPEKYFEFTEEPKEKKKDKKPFLLSLQQLKEIERLLSKSGLDCSVIQFLDYLKTAIEYREYAKFIFTHNLSDALKLFGELAGEYNFNRQETSFADIGIVKKCYCSELNFGEELRKSINEGKERFQLTRCLLLPPIICNPFEVYSFFSLDNQPNFITLGKIIGNTCTSNEDLSSKIVFLPNADPGYNWIFEKGIAGFITMYGGANSHMAIVASELQIPAIIGIGEKKYYQYIKTKRLEIDCMKKIVKVIS